MAHGWSVLAACGLLLLAGCIQIEVAPAGAGAQGQAFAASADATARDKYAVACILIDPNGNALPTGSCEYRFGALGATAQVDADGKAVRLVPAGATGTVTGSAPGHAAARATLIVDRDKTVRMTLPELPKDAPQSGPRANSTENAAPPTVSENATEWENATVYYTSTRDLLHSQAYPIAAAQVPTVTYRFDVGPQYQSLEVNGAYFPPGVYANMVTVRILDPNGTVVLEWTERPYPSVVAVGNRLSEFPLGFVYAPTPGSYTVEVEGAGVPTFQLYVYGLAGLAPDFSFTNVLDGQVHNLNEYAGRIVIVDLMAAWCGPCNDAMPALTKIRNDYNGAVEILSIDVTYDDSGNPDTPQSDTPQDLRDFIAKHGVTWPIGPDSKTYRTSASSAYGTGYIPTLVLVDQHGALLFRHIGAMDDAELRAMIDRALAAG